MRVRLGRWAATTLLLLLPVVVAASAVSTTQVADTVYRADGTVATGSVVISWAAFTTAGGQEIAGGSTSATIAADGTFSVQLAPNAGATPVGTYYAAVYHLNDGSVTREYWLVPVSSAAVTVSAVRSTVLPTSVAMQTVTKSYVDAAIAAAVAGTPISGTTPFVNRAGDTLTGPLILSGDPTAALQAADKHYVDTNLANVASGLAGNVSMMPQAAQAVVQPAGTQLSTNRLNGTTYASQFVSGRGNNGIAAALASSDCASGCDVKVDPTYSLLESYQTPGLPSGAMAGTHVEDLRGGEKRESYMNPVDTLISGNDAAEVIDVVSTRSAASVFQRTNAEEPSSEAVLINHRGLTGGSNLFPSSLGTYFPYFKSSYSALSVNGSYNTMGQHVLQPNAINCYGVGDCLMGSQILTVSGGFRDEADEGAHPFDLQVREDTQVFQGTCSAGCSTRSRVVTVATTSGAGTQGEGRFLIDKAPTKVLTTGVLTSGAAGATGTPGATAIFTGTTFPVSIFLATAQVIPSQASNMAPGTVSVAIASSGTPAGFSTSTAALPSASGVACVADAVTTSNPTNYEMVPYTVTDATHLQMTFNKLHGSRATLAFGGLCGYGLEQTVDTSAGIRQVFPVIGSYSATGLYYAAGLVPLVGTSGLSSAYLNLNVPVASVTRLGGITTVTMASALAMDVNGLTLTVNGVSDTSYNGVFVVTSTGPNSLTYANSGANGTSSGGTVGLVTGGFALYPMAEVLGVFNQGTASVDGQLTLAANNVAWANGDAVEEPHFYEQAVGADLEFVSQTIPRATPQMRAGIEYDGNNGPGLRGWTITNASPAANYFGNGGTHVAPDTAFEVRGVWSRVFEAEAGNDAVFNIHCNSRGCGRWDSAYSLFQLDSAAGIDTVGYQPATNALTFALHGTNYSFTPQALTAGTINATTVNATAINGNVSASHVTGTLAAAQLPVFGGSGGLHSAGAVPDPGIAAGTTRYLREDGSWAVPPGSGSGSGTQTSGATLLPGATADLRFLDAAGTTVSDSSGNGNAATLSSNAPQWTSTGLAFSPQQGVSLPAALNGTQSFFLAVYINPILPTTSVNQYPVLVSSSTGGGGFNLMYAFSTSSGQFIQGAYAPTLYVNNQHTTEAPNLLSGFHVLGVVLGSGSGSVDRFYIDGTEVATYTAQGSSAGAQGSGNLYLGSSGANPWGYSGFDGTLYRLRTYPFAVGASDVKTITGAIRNEIALRGVATSPQPVQLAAPQLHAVGDSITYGRGVTTPWPSLLSLVNQPAYSLSNWGVMSVTMQAITGSDPNRVATRCQSSSGPTVALVSAGTNDFGAGSGASASQVLSYLAGEVQTLKQAGCRVFVGTMLSRGGNDASGATSFDADKDAYDALILGQWTTLGADGVLDFAAIPQLGADGAFAGSFFQNDQTHPTQAGQALLAAAASNALNYAFGYSTLSPHTVTSLPYSMTASDGAISLNGVGSAGALTLPDCTGQSGAVYRINNPQSVYAVTIGPLNANQLINGLPFGTAVTVPANGTLLLRDVPNPKAVSGCHWEM